MRKLWKLGLSVALAASFLIACGQEPAKETDIQKEQNHAEEINAAFPITVTDAVGTDVTMEAAPEKIVSLIPSNTEILFGLGLANEIVGVNDSDNYPAETEQKEKIGGMEFNIEKIVALEPDIVFAHESIISYSEAGIEQLEAAGVKVYVVKNATTFEETYKTMQEIGLLTGKTVEAEEMIATTKEKLAKIEEKLQGVESKSVFVTVGMTPDIYAAGQNTYINEMLKLIKATNIVQEEGWPMYSAENFVASNPSTILVMYPDDVTTLQTNAAFADMDAVKNNAIYVVDEDTTSRQGPRLAEGVEALAKAIYPEVFGE